ncbi:sensor histidine kinase N-terminal domain-containing protein (plasmid) [Rhizobium indicum]|uniref:sensor histidine kinase n=1 Tax=Rhizobium indicum TaxID=2583231 RepID=UPI00110683BD|nr:ATP-binding protein [Rhizobium indicum]QKK33368.1 sensor histidine kinase N-terminal domain-containing protein [Rhizobium indicum]
MTLSQRLFLRILPTLIITIAVIGFFAYRSATREIDNIYDAQLINDANVLWSLMKHPLTRPLPRPTVQVPDLDFNMDNQLALNEDADDYADAHSFRAWKGGALAFASSNAFPAEIKQFTAGFSDVTYQAELWRIYSLPIPNSDITIEVAEKIVLREGLVENILLNLAFPLLILVPVIAIIIWLAINNGLINIRELVSQIRARTPDDLSMIATRGLPRDLAPLVHSLNNLLRKLGRSLTMERRFSDLAAHQLRTPQAGIKLLLQLFDRADSDDERRALLKDLVVSNDRAMHLIEQLLRLARVSHQPLQLEPLPLREIAAAAVADFGALLNNRNFDVGLIGAQDANVLTDHALLRVMIDNLLDNAIKYSPDRGKIEVRIEPGARGWRLSIMDNGPGIPPEQRDAAFQRFNRLDAHAGEGAGLGLPIVVDIGNRLEIGITLGTPAWGRGLRVDLDIPAA